MSRPLRLQYPGAVYHITSRCNGRQKIFKDQTDFFTFIDLLGKEILQQNWKCYAYCLMNNHYHLLIETPEGNLVNGMRRLNSVYTQKFNRRYKRIGHVLQGRYKSIIVEKENYLLELCRYIELNPLRARIVNEIEKWKWSSYRMRIGKANEPKWLDRDYILGQFGKSKRKSIERYKEFVMEGIGSANPMEEVKGQIWLGSEGFLRSIDKLIKNGESKEIPKEQKEPLRPRKEDIMREVLRLYGVGEEEILRRENKDAYRAMVYLLRRLINMGIVEVSKMFKISQSMVSRIQRETERGVMIDKSFNKLLKKYKLQI